MNDVSGGANADGVLVMPLDDGRDLIVPIATSCDDADPQTNPGATAMGAALARRLRERGAPVRLFVVSPGGTPGTNGVSNLPLVMRTAVFL